MYIRFNSASKLRIHLLFECIRFVTKIWDVMSQWSYVNIHNHHCYPANVLANAFHTIWEFYFSIEEKV